MLLTYLIIHSDPVAGIDVDVDSHGLRGCGYVVLKHQVDETRLTFYQGQIYMNAVYANFIYMYIVCVIPDMISDTYDFINSLCAWSWQKHDDMTYEFIGDLLIK